MNLEKKKEQSSAVRNGERVGQTASRDKDKSLNRQSLPAGEWLRKVLGIETPFGHDGLPTVWE